MASPWPVRQQPRRGGFGSSGCRDWSELPLDALASIFGKLGGIEILMGPGLVCRSWLQAAKVPELWRSVDMARHLLVDEMDDDAVCAMARAAVDRAAGQLQVFKGKGFVTDELLQYIGDRYLSFCRLPKLGHLWTMDFYFQYIHRCDMHMYAHSRSPDLKGLVLASCYGVSNNGFTDLVTKCPLLQDLHLLLCDNVGGRDVYEATGKACAQLKTFRLRKGLSFIRSAGEAQGVAVMHELRSLSLLNTGFTNDELACILDGCPRLEHLDLSDCFNVVVVDDALKARCAGIKSMTFPDPVEQEDYWREYWPLSYLDIDYATARLELVDELDGDALCAMARVAVDRAAGQLQVFQGKGFVTDELLKVHRGQVSISPCLFLSSSQTKLGHRSVFLSNTWRVCYMHAHRSPGLKGLVLISCDGVSNNGFTELVTRCPLLQDLHIVFCDHVGGCDVYETTGRACAPLKSFLLRKRPWRLSTHLSAGEVLGIAAMHELRSLTLNDDVTNDELASILDGCPHLEFLDLSDCYGIVVDDALMARCAGIKSVTFPEVDEEEEYYLDQINSHDELCLSIKKRNWSSF
ncbi:hypothetical protein U9M48_040495 [Paspalum notatum var. saurae]|uniref:F-box domain-containing protein n=1 Tax=Paspalum notatum var. saurae TaxID=547442 RepID=A0AAQ3XCF9_PASNO